VKRLGSRGTGNRPPKKLQMKRLPRRATLMATPLPRRLATMRATALTAPTRKRRANAYYRRVD
jgi:hypothetical protein